MTAGPVTVATFANSFNAHMAKITLAEHGIKSVVTGENLLTAFPQFGWLGLDLQVLNKDAGRAQELLAGNQLREQK